VVGLRSLVERSKRALRSLKIDSGAKLGKCMHRLRKVLSRAKRLNHGIGPTKLVMRARATITVAQHVKNRHAATEVLSSLRRVRAAHSQHAKKALCFSGKSKIGGGVAGFLLNLLKLRGAGIQHPRNQETLRQQQSGFTNVLPVTNLLGEFKRRSGFFDSSFGIFECDQAPTQGAQGLPFIPFVTIIVLQGNGTLEQFLRFVQVPSKQVKLCEGIKNRGYLSPSFIDFSSKLQRAFKCCLRSLPLSNENQVDTEVVITERCI